MMNRIVLLAPISLICLAAALPACGESREAYRDEAAETACKRERECGNIGDGKSYRTDDDCIVDKTDDFNKTWPSDQCKDDRINEDKFDGCMSRLSTIACDGFTRLADVAAFSSECNADKVCID
jgi:hypothetical protein